MKIGGKLFIVAAAIAGASIPGPARAAGVTIPATATTPALPAYLARPAGTTPAPAVVVLHGCEGYTSAYGGVADTLARQGYVAVAIDSLAPQGLKSACSDGAAQSRIQAHDAVATLAWLRTQPFVDGDRLALVGFSLGAIATLDVVDARAVTAAPPGLQAAVTFYPACRGRDAASVLVPIRILDGSADDWTPAPPCQDLADAAQAAGKTVAITTYPDATHAFNFPGPDRITLGHHLRFDAPAAADASAQMMTFLAQYLGAHP